MKELATYFVKGIMVILSIFGAILGMALAIGFPAILGAVTGNDAWLWCYSFHVVIVVIAMGMER